MNDMTNKICVHTTCVFGKSKKPRSVQSGLHESGLRSAGRLSTPSLFAGLRLRWVAGIFLVPALALAQSTAGSSTASALPDIRVTSTADAPSYNATSASGATRTETPLRELPQAVRVMTARQIDDLGALRLSDTVDFVSGISRLNDFGGTWDNFAMRGFNSTDMGYLVNGMLGQRGYNPRRDTANVERIEFLKGPAAAVYGSSEPGGTLNIVTKKPQFAWKHALELSAGSLGLKRAALDSTGPLSPTVAYRLNAMSEEGESRSGMLNNRRSLLAPSLSWAINPATLVNYEGEFLRVSTPLDRGVINVDGVLGLVPRDRIFNEPSDDNMSQSSNMHQLTLDHALSANWRTRFGASYKESSFDGYYTEASELAANRRTMPRRFTFRQLPSRDALFQAELEGKFQLAGFDHTLLVGGEMSRLWIGIVNVRSTASTPIDIYQPVYGKPAPALNSLTLSTDEHQRVKGIFLQDQIGLSEKWKLLAGLRWDQYNQSMASRAPKLSNTAQQQSALSPRVGLTYLANGWSSYYVSAGQSFRANSGVDVNNRAFDPQHSTAYEAGVKLQTTDERLGATLAVYDITKTNVLTASDIPGVSVAAGEVKSTGFEADVYGQLSANWRLSGNFSWDNARVTKDKVQPAGRRLVNVPGFSGGLLVLREDAFPDGSRYGLGSGLNFVGNRSGNTIDSYSLPGYALVKLLSYWQINKNLRATLDVHNLFNRTYYPSSFNNLYVWSGLERSIVLRLKAEM